MSCFRPLKAHRVRGGAKVRIGTDARGDGDHMELPCGKCIGCRSDRARMWAIRIMHEAQLYESNLCLTLTYRDEKLPPNWSLRYRDFALFMKRLRKRFVGFLQGRTVIVRSVFLWLASMGSIRRGRIGTR